LKKGERSNRSRAAIVAMQYDARSRRDVSNIVSGMIDSYGLSIMELRHLRYFVQVADDLHFARAARRLGISQPPLSQQIRALEDELGVRLLDRTSRSVALTRAGALFLDEARATLAQAERAVTVARRAARGEVGVLAIGFNASAPFIPRIAKAIHDFRGTYPEVRLALAEKNGLEQIEAVRDRVLDLGILRRSHPPELPEPLVATRLLEERLYVAMRPDHPLAAKAGLALRDLHDAPMLLYAQARSSGFTAEFIALLREEGVEPRIVQTVQEVSTLFGLAAAGLGITVLAESLCALQAANLTYRPLLDDRAMSATWLILRRDNDAVACRNFLHMVGAEA
jgi:DNA-binding transcriptional LysR family regulator